MQPFTTFVLLLFMLFLYTNPTESHNITKILASHPSLSTFNHYLTVTHLAAEINRRQTITVLALDNAAMNTLLAKQLSVYTLRNVLSLHVLVDYFGAKKLHQITDGTTLTASMFQATGDASGTSGYVNITVLHGGKVGFGPEDNGGKLEALYVKSVVEIPYNISVLEISQALNSAEAEAPTAAPTLNLTSIMSKDCKAFLDLLKATDGLPIYEQNLDGGLTVFCPPDTVVKGFAPKYNNLTKSQKLSLLLYHAFPIYQSMQMLKSNNGLVNTLATDGASKYDITVQDDGEDVKLETKVVTASITGILKDEEPLVVYKIDKMLLPHELFKAAPTKKGQKSEADAPDADAPSDDSADSTADDHDNGVGKMGGEGPLISALLSVCAGVIFFF